MAIENPIKHNDVNRSSEAIRFPLSCFRGGYSNRKTVVWPGHRNGKDDGLPVGSVARVCFGVMKAEASHTARLELVVL